MSVSKSGAAKRSRSSVRSSALSRQVRRGLLGSTALVAAAVAASGAAAQSTQPAEGGLIDGPGTFVDSTASGGGVVWNSSSNNPITLSSGVVIHNTTGTGTPHAYAQVSSAGSAVLTNIDPLVLSTTVNGGAALFLQTGANVSWGVSQFDPASTVDLTGSYGGYFEAPAGFVNIVDFGTTTGLRNITASGTAVAGLYGTALTGVNFGLKAPVISGFATGIRAESSTVGVSTTGGSISASQYGIYAAATTGDATVTSGGSITSGGSGIRAIATTGKASVTVNGAIQSGSGVWATAAGGGVLDINADITSTIHSASAITVGGGAFDLDIATGVVVSADGEIGVRVAGSADVANAGTIIGGYTALQNDYGTTVATNISNTGVIQGGTGHGIMLQGVGGDIVNGSGGVIQTNGLAGVFLTGGSLSNSGVITGGSNGGSGYGAYIGSNSQFVNLSGGSISAGSGTALVLGAGATADLRAGSTTTGKIVTAGTANVTFAGQFDGAYVGGSGVDTLTFNATSAGTQSFTGGGGTDTLNFTTGGLGVVTGTFSGFESANFSNGSWQLGVDLGVTDINMLSGSLRLTATGAAGSAVIHMIDPALIFGVTGTYSNDISLEVADGQQAGDPTNLQNGSGGPITLAGRIYETAGVGGAGQYVTFGGTGLIEVTNDLNSWGGVTRIGWGTAVQGTTASISGGSIAVDGNLYYRQDTAGTVTQDISGAGRVAVYGTGPVTFAGDLTHGGFLASGSLGVQIVLEGERSGGTAEAVLLSGGLTVSETGSILGGAHTAVRVLNSSTLDNFGSIASDGYAIDAGNVLALTNSGEVNGSVAGVRLGYRGTVTNQDGGRIYGAAAIDNASGALTLDNQAGGWIIGSNQGVLVGGASASITNSGIIRGLGGDAVMLEGGGATVTNALGGVIAAGGNEGVFSRSAGNSVINAGVIAGQNNGLTGNDHAVTVTNSGLIVSGLVADATTTLAQTTRGGGHGVGLTHGGTVTNLAGGVIGGGDGGVTIVGGSGAIANAGLIDADGGSGVNMNGGGTLTNQAGGVIAGTLHGVFLEGASAYTIDLQAGSTVNGDIHGLAAGGSKTVTVAGTLNGDYVGGSGADSISLAATGSMVGVSLGGGDDVFNWAGGAFSGVIDGGFGADVFNVDMGTSGSATLDLADILNFETRTLDGGALTLAGASPSQRGWTVSGADATLNIGATGQAATLTTTGPGVTVTAADATLNVAAGSQLASSNNVAVYGSGEGLTINNAGAMTSATTSAIYISGADGAVVNSGTITGVVGAGTYIPAVFVYGANGSVTNLAGGLITGRRGVELDGANGAVVNSGTITATYDNAVSLLAGGSVTNDVGGTLTATGTGGAWGVYVFGGAGTVTNHGVITAGGSGVMLDADAAHVVTNTGAITAGNGNGAHGVMTTGALTLTNAGTISYASGGAIGSVNYGVYGVGSNTVVDNQAGGLIEGRWGGVRANTGTLTVTNAGVIDSARFSAVETNASSTITNLDGGVLKSLSGEGAGLLLNDGVHVVDNRAGGLIQGGAAGIHDRGPGAVTLTNAGEITGGTYGILSYGGGLLTVGNSGSVTGVIGVAADSGGVITNHAGGAITGTGGTAINLSGSAAYTLNLEAGSTVTGAIVASGSGAKTVTLSGAIGSYTGGSGVDTFVMHAGGSLVSANLGDGDDVFTYYGGTITGAVDGGLGLDTLFADFGAGGSGTLVLDHFVNFDAFGLVGGDATLTGTSANPGAAIYAGNGAPAGTLTFTDTADITGDIYVNGGDIRAATAGAFGTGVIHMIDPTATFAATGTYANAISLEVVSPASGDPSTLNTTLGVTATLTGAITQGSGGAIDAVQPLVIGGQGTIVLTNTANDWAGSTTIDAGATLRGASDTISGSSIVANGVLAYVQPGSGVVGQNISGAGRVEVSGLGAGETLTFSGASTVAGGLVFANGTSGAISGTGSVTAARAILLQGGGELTNAGTITGGTGGLGQVGIYSAGAGETIINAATGAISGWRGFETAGANTTLDNAGVISGLNDMGAAFFGTGGSVTNRAGGQISGATFGLYSNAGTTLTLVNDGLVQGGAHGLLGFTDAVVNVTNNATGVMRGDNYNAVYAGGAGSTIVNAGLMSGGNAAIYFDGANTTIANTGVVRVTGSTAPTVISGIYVAGANASVTNSGTIESTLTDGRGVYLSGGGGSIVNQSGGVISGNGDGAAILLTGAGYTLDLQAGSTVNGLIDASLTTGPNTVTVGGALNGGYAGGSATDDLTLLSGGAFGQALLGGDGVDSLTLAGAGDGALDMGLVAGFESRVLNGSGAWTLSGTDLSVGDWTLNSGTLRVTGGNSISDAAGVTVTVNAGAALEVVQSEAVDGLSGTGSIRIDAAQRLSVGHGGADSAFGGVISGSGGLDKFGAGVLTLSGANTFTGDTNVYQGTLRLGAADVISDLSTLVVQPGGTLDLQGFDETVAGAYLFGALNGGGTLTAAFYELIDATVNANLGAGNLIHRSGVTALNGTSQAELVSVLGGTLSLGASDRLNDVATLSVASGATLDLGAHTETVGALGLNGTLAGTGRLTAGRYELTGATVNADLGAGLLLQLGGSSVLNGASASTEVAVLGGTLALGGADRLNDAATLSLASGATLDMGAHDDAVGAAALAGTLAGSGVLTATEYQLNGATVNAGLGGGDLYNVGGTSVLNGAVAADLVSVLDGALRLGAADRLADGATVLVASGATLDLGAHDDTVGALGLAGTLAGTGTLTAGQYQLDGATVNANLGAGDLVNVGGTSVLNGRAGGDVSVNAGTLTLGASDRLADAATVVVGAGATLDLGAHDDTVGALGLAGTLAGTGTLTAERYQLDAATVNADLGAGTLFQIGGTSVLSGAALAEAVAVNAGALRLGAADRLSDAATVSVAAGATLDLNDFDDRVGALQGMGAIDLGSGRLTFGGADSAFGGRIDGAGSVVHTGGLFTLAGDHTAALLASTGGEMRFLGSTTGDVSASAGALTGAGTIGGALTVSGGATLSPGVAGTQNGVGGFTVGSLTLTGGTLALDVLGRSGGNAIDQIRVDGLATLTGGAVAPDFHGAATDFDFSTQYLFLQADSLGGTFSNGASFTAAGPDGLFWRVRYDVVANGAVIELRQMTDFDPGAAGTGNQRAIGRALSGGQIGASDDYAGVLSLLAGLDQGDQLKAFDSLSGEPLADMTTSLRAVNDAFLNAVSGAGGAGDSGGGALDFASQLSFSGGRDSDASRLADMLQAFDPAATAGQGLGGWVSSWSTDQRLDGKAGQATVDTRANGFAGGYGAGSGRFSVGAAAGVSRMEGDVAARLGHYESDLTHTAGYVRFDDGAWTADVTATFYGGELQTRRGVQIGPFGGTASGRSHADGRAVSASVARRFQVTDDGMIALGLQGVAADASVDGFTETGAGGLSLQVSAIERDWQSINLSLRATQDYRVDGNGMRIYGGLGLLATTGDRAATGDMRLSGAPAGFGAFAIQGAETPPLAGVVDFGLEVEAAEGVTVSAGYRGVHGDRLEDNQVGFRLKAAW